MNRSHITLGNYLHRIPPRHLKILKGMEDEDERWIRHMLKLSGSDEGSPQTALGTHDGLNSEDEAWIQKMLSFAHEAPQEEKKEERSTDRFDEALINDFIHNEGIFAE